MRTSMPDPNCPECKGTGEYRGFIKIEPCSVCCTRPPENMSPNPGANMFQVSNPAVWADLFWDRLYKHNLQLNGVAVDKNGQPLTTTLSTWYTSFVFDDLLKAKPDGGWQDAQDEIDARALQVVFHVPQPASYLKKFEPQQPVRSTTMDKQTHYYPLPIRVKLEYKLEYRGTEVTIEIPFV